MRKLLALLLLGTLCATALLQDERAGQGAVGEAIGAAVEAIGHLGEGAVRLACESLGGQRERHHGAGRAALTDRTTARIDRRADHVAQSAPASAERSVDALAAYLEEHAGPTMRGRTRAAFRWVADHVAYDHSLTTLERMLRDTQSPEVVLRTRKAVCVGYARLFVTLAKKMGLEAALIKGQANPAGLGDGGNHVWASVHLADGWYLIDPTWAAGHVSQGRFVSRFDEEWWLVPPERMQYTHRPDDHRWILRADHPTRPGPLGQFFNRSFCGKRKGH